MRILLITCVWPSKSNPNRAPYLVMEVNQLRKYGIYIDVFAFSGKKNPLNYIKSWIILRRNYKLNDYDVIHAEWGQSGLLALPKKIPLVVTLRGSDLEGIVDHKGRITIAGYILRYVTRIVALFADKIILVSDSLSKYLPKKKYIILPVCLDLNLFKPIEKNIARDQLKLSHKKKYILFPSDPSRPEKRFRLAEAAVKKLGGDVELIVTRKVPHTQMVLYYNACDTLLITSTHEGAPTVVYEALACNMPIVSVDVGDIRERISHIDGCIVCRNDTPDEISLCIQKVLMNERRINSREFVTEFSSENFSKKMLEIYQSCITSKRKNVNQNLLESK